MSTLSAYSEDALARMARGNCPECGYATISHTGGGGPRGCTLTDNGVAQRLHEFNQAVAKIKLKEPDRWMSVSRHTNDGVSQSRHVVARGSLTSACGCTASHPEVWRGVMDGRKQRCPRCIAVVLKDPRYAPVPEPDGVISYTRISAGYYLVLLDEVEIGQVHHEPGRRSTPLWKAKDAEHQVIVRHMPSRRDAAERLAAHVQGRYTQVS